MERFPEEFAELLTPSGRALVEGTSELKGTLGRSRFFTSNALLDPALSRQVPALLERTFADLLVEIDRGVPNPKSSFASHIDMLPKIGRMLSTPTEGGEDTEVWRRGEQCGAVQMMTSKSYLAFVEALCGHAVLGPVTLQALCYRPGDYAGPHTDNHPEEKETKDGYTDVHLTFCTPDVEQQLLVYEHQGHLSQVANIVGDGTVTAYRLPFWHYTTPMVGAKAARRWLLLGSFVHP